MSCPQVSCLPLTLHKYRDSLASGPQTLMTTVEGDRAALSSAEADTTVPGTPFLRGRGVGTGAPGDLLRDPFCKAICSSQL